MPCRLGGGGGARDAGDFLRDGLAPSSDLRSRRGGEGPLKTFVFLLFWSELLYLTSLPLLSSDDTEDDTVDAVEADDSEVGMLLDDVDDTVEDDNSDDFVDDEADEGDDASDDTDSASLSFSGVVILAVFAALPMLPPSSLEPPAEVRECTLPSSSVTVCKDPILVALKTLSSSAFVSRINLATESKLLFCWGFVFAAALARAFIARSLADKTDSSSSEETLFLLS